MKIFAQRNGGGSVVGLFLSKPRFPVEEIDEDHPDVQAFHDSAEIPTQVELWKARTAMKMSPWTGNFGGPGKTVFDAVVAAATAIPDVTKKRLVLEAVDYTNFVTRKGELVGIIKQALGMTDAQFDAIFLQAVSIKG